MGSAYSVNGFVNAVLQRSGKTLLVEGITDKGILHRLCQEAAISADYLIDHAGILSGDDCRGLGNREKVLKVKELVTALCTKFPRLAESLVFLIDREWDGLEQGELRLRGEWRPPGQRPNDFVTLGHSIENYGFRSAHVVGYLKFYFSELVKPGFIRLIEDSFPQVLVLASCISVALEESELLTRAGGILGHHHLDVMDSRIRVDAAFSDALSQRDVSLDVAERVVARANSLVDAYAEELTGKVEIMWLPHGHLGEDVVWAATGCLARLSGIDIQVCDRIVTYGRQDRFRFMADYLAKRPSAEAHPLPDVVTWLTT